MDAKIDREDAKKLIQVVLHKGDVSFSNLKDVLDKAGVLKDAEIIEKCELKAQYADNHATTMKEIEQAKSMRVELSNKVKDVLEANGYDIPVLSEEEKNEIQALFERRNGLNELSQILTVENEALYEKLVKDLGETGVKFQDWWNRMGEKYNWESAEGGNWEIDFDTCSIYLVTEQVK